jgi:NnrU protein
LSGELLFDVSSHHVNYSTVVIVIRYRTNERPAGSILLDANGGDRRPLNRRSFGPYAAAREQHRRINRLPRDAVRSASNHGVTGNPFLWEVGLWAVGHIAVTRDLASVLSFGSVGSLGLTGAPLLDAKKARRRGRQGGGSRPKPRA